MNYAGRFNSFIFKGENVFDAIEAYKNMDGITHLEFNYPEHIEGYDFEELKAAIAPLKVNGLAVRWRKDFLDGNFTNPNNSLRERAIQMSKDACDVCRELGGSVITLWFENDGFDYPFQIDYEKDWKLLVEGLREVADYAPDMKISIEYKPFEERNFALVDSAGMTLYLVNEVDRDNVGCTLDYCHMLMKHDNPSFGLALAASKGKLFGLHMNDGYGVQDSGLIFGSLSFAQSAEFVYYLEKYNYDGVVFFDTFPIREESKAECQANIDAFELIKAKIDKQGVDNITEVVSKHDGISAQGLILDLLR
ncbi:MAG: sugar phosphate isomerase/epimerase family protein [Eubacteriales bacterium]|nr:sugar phosphate isomerase/epimerase family protein [Eubacteriales bacterium]